MGETQHHLAPTGATDTAPATPNQASDIVAVGRAFRRGMASLVELRAALDQGVLYALRPNTPGLLVFDLPTGGGRWTVACTSLPALQRFIRARGQRARTGGAPPEPTSSPTCRPAWAW
jgi:hypothetical protein